MIIKKVKAWMFIPDGYPDEPPKVYFEMVRGKDGKWTRFNHINVSMHGQMCQNINKKEQQYSKLLSMIEVLEEVQNLLYNINVTSAYDGPLFKAYDTKYADGGKEYQRTLAEQSELLEWASDISSDSDSD